MCKRPVIISSKASTKYAYHAKEIFIVEGTTEKYIFFIIKKSLFLPVWLGFTNTSLSTITDFIMIGFLMGDINIQCFNMLVTSVRKKKPNNVTLIPYLM